MNAIFGAGCFWHVQYAFDKLKGVKTMVGYSGGNKKNPTYKEVCSGLTGHAEVVFIEYNKEEISYKELLDVFFRIHDPTQLNRQGVDVGSQYRSVIFYFDQEQKHLAENKIREQQNNYVEKIVTQVLFAKEFFPAEEYHQKYISKGSGYC